MTHLGKVLSAYQQKYDVEGKALAREIGIEESSLSRIKSGSLPDAENFIRIISWLVRRSPDPSHSTSAEKECVCVFCQG